MKRTALALLAAFFLTGTIALAHGGAEHVQGTVISITDTAVTVQTTAKKARTITLDAKTMVMRGKAHLSVSDVKVGDRIVIEIDKKTSMATEMKLGAVPAAAARKPSADHAAHKN